MDDDPLLVSLADALTCAFGASIALFLIFVVLVRFDPPSPVVTSGAQHSNSLVASLAQEEPGASSLVFLADSTVDELDCTRSAVHSLKVEGVDKKNTRTWKETRPRWSFENRQGTFCRTVIEVPDGVQAGKLPTLVAGRTNKETIRLRVHVGANAWPANGTYRIGMPPFAPSEIKLLQVTNSATDPIKTQDEL